MVTSYETIKKNQSLVVDDDYINLLKIFKVIKRNKKFILTFSFLLAILSTLYSLSQEKVWRGKFNIVIPSSTIAGNSIRNGRLTSLLNSEMKNSINTKVEILKSPSVLFPTYEFYKSELLNSGINYNKSFDKWSKKLDIKLKDKTNVVDVKFLDNDKKLIVLTLDKISSAFQKYAGNEKEIGLNNSIQFLQTQIAVFENRVRESYKEADNYGKKNGIYIVNSDSYVPGLAKLPEQINDDSSELLTTNVEIATRRANFEIIKLKEAIRRINDAETNADYNLFNLNISNIIQLDRLNQTYINDSFQELIEIDKNIEFRKIHFTKNDTVLNQLLTMKERKMLALKNKMNDILKIAILEREEIIKANYLPNEVILKYKSIIRDAARDDATLTAMETNLRALQLDSARNVIPWSTISKATLDDFPVRPRKKLYALGGLLFGLFLSTILSKLYESKKNIIYEIEDIQNFFEIEKRCIVSYDNLNENENLELFFKSLLNAGNKKLSLLENSEISSDLLQKLKSNLKFYNEKIDIFQNFQEALINNEQIILCEIGKTSKNYLSNLKTKYELINKIPVGIIIFENYDAT